MTLTEDQRWLLRMVGGWAMRDCLIVTGPRTRLWGFWCKDLFGETRSRQHEAERFVPWDEFGDAGCGER